MLLLLLCYLQYSWWLVYLRALRLLQLTGSAADAVACGWEGHMLLSGKALLERSMRQHSVQDCSSCPSDA
jgi:hypothetical protein